MHHEHTRVIGGLQRQIRQLRNSVMAARGRTRSAAQETENYESTRQALQEQVEMLRESIRSVQKQLASPYLLPPTAAFPEGQMRSASARRSRTISPPRYYWCNVRVLTNSRQSLIESVDLTPAADDRLEKAGDLLAEVKKRYKALQRRHHDTVESLKRSSDLPERLRQLKVKRQELASAETELARIQNRRDLVKANRDRARAQLQEISQKLREIDRITEDLERLEQAGADVRMKREETLQQRANKIEDWKAQIKQQQADQRRLLEDMDSKSDQLRAVQADLAMKRQTALVTQQQFLQRVEEARSASREKMAAAAHLQREVAMRQANLAKTSSAKSEVISPHNDNHVDDSAAVAELASLKQQMAAMEQRERAQREKTQELQVREEALQQKEREMAIKMQQVHQQDQQTSQSAEQSVQMQELKERKKFLEEEIAKTRSLISHQ